MNFWTDDPTVLELLGYAAVALLDLCMVVGLIAHFVFGWNP